MNEKVGRELLALRAHIAGLQREVDRYPLRIKYRERAQASRDGRIAAYGKVLREIDRRLGEFQKIKKSVFSFEQVALMKLLIRGRTDEEIAARRDLPLHKVMKMIGVLMQHFGVTSREQLIERAGSVFDAEDRFATTKQGTQSESSKVHALGNSQSGG